MENVLKQQVLDLQADAMSTHYLASNQLRLWLAAFGTCCWNGSGRWAATEQNWRGPPLERSG